MTASTEGHAPHPFIGGRTAVLRALAAWRMAWPGAPRVVVLTGNPGSGVSRLITGFLMLCEAEYRKQLPLDAMDPATVPPELPAPATPAAAGLTAAQILWLIADHYDLEAETSQDVFAGLTALGGPVSVVIPDVDRAGPVRGSGEPARVVRDVLKPLASADSCHLLVELPRDLAADLTAALPAGVAQVIDLDEPEWADPDALVMHAAAALNPRFGAARLAFTEDEDVRVALARAIGHRAGSSHLLVELFVDSLLMSPEGFVHDDETQLPGSLGEVLDQHSRRLGTDPQLLRTLLAPLALGPDHGLPVDVWIRLAGAVAGQDMSSQVANGKSLVGPFVQPVDVERAEQPHIRLAHPAIAAEVRRELSGVRAVQSRIAQSLLAAVPEQDWGKAAPYVRDHIATHTLEAGLLPQLLTDPGLFVHADPVILRSAIEAVPLEELEAPARTYLRTSPLLTRTEADPRLRAALLETAFVEDGLPEYAEAVHRLGLDLPWQTLWSLPQQGIGAVTVGGIPQAGTTQTAPVAVLVVPEGTPGAHATGNGSGLLVQDLDRGTPLGEMAADQVVRPSGDERAAGPFALSRGTDYVRVWDRTEQKVVAALVSDTPFTGADLSPGGVLLIATQRGARALRITHQPQR